MLDVDVLAQAVLKFRDIFMKLDVDPWRYVTLPSLCKDMYINKFKFMPEKTIVGNTSNKPVSRVSKEWFAYLNDKDIENEIPIKIYTNKSTKHYKNGTHIYS